MARTDNLPNFLTDVATSIKSKTGDSTSIPASQFDTKINSIESMQDGFDENKVSSYVYSNYVFNSVPNAKKCLLYMLIDKVPYLELDFTHTTSLYMAFNGCLNLSEVDVSGWDVSTINDFSYVFANCEKLTEIDLSNWNVMTLSTTGYINYMFNSCPSLKRINLSSFQGGNWSIDSLFKGCTSLESLDISGLDLVNCTNQSSFLGNATATTPTNVPYNCEIIVANQTQKNWMTTNFSNYTNVRIKGA